MNSHAPSSRRLIPSAAGYSLTEVIVALGLVLTTALPMLGVLSIGLNDSRAAIEQRAMESIRTSIRAKLQSPAWPTSQSGQWTTSRWFTAEGSESGREPQKTSVIEARMSAGPGFGFSSTALESVRVEFVSVASGKVLGESLIQRARQDRVTSAP